MKQRTRVVTVMSTSGALVVGALIGAVYVTLSLGGSTPAPVQVQQVSQSVPTSNPTTAAPRKAAVAKPVKKVAAKTTAPTSSKARSLVNTEKAQTNQAADEPTVDTPLSGGGDGRTNAPTSPPNDPAPTPAG